MRLIRLLKNDIAREASEWVDDDLITNEQAVAICARYDVDFYQVSNRSFGYAVLIGLGYLFIGLAVITILGANWDDIPRAVRMWGLIIVTVSTQWFAMKKYFSADLGSGLGFFLLGNFFFGASIILIAQIYHLGEHMPDGVFWWALGCLPIALLTKSRVLMLQTLSLSLIWFLLEVEMGFYPSLFPLFILSSLYILMRSKQTIALFLMTLIGIVLWLEYTLSIAWSAPRLLSFGVEHLAVSVGLFIFAYAFAHFLNTRQSLVAKDYGAVLALWCLRLGIILMLAMSFEDPWREVIESEWKHLPSMVFIAVALSAIALYLAYGANKFFPFLAINILYWLTLALVVITENKNAAVYFQVAYNIALIGMGIWLVLRGIHSGISHYFFLGISSILLTALMRYIDLIGDYVGGAILFAVFAAILLSAAKYWKNVQGRESQP